MAVYEKKQGESFALKKGLTIDDVAQVFGGDWACRLVLKEQSDGLRGGIILDKAITEKSDFDTRFVVRITPAEMAALSVKKYIFIVELSSASNAINNEDQDTLDVKQQGIS